MEVHSIHVLKYAQQVCLQTCQQLHLRLNVKVVPQYLHYAQPQFVMLKVARVHLSKGHEMFHTQLWKPDIADLDGMRVRCLTQDLQQCRVRDEEKPGEHQTFALQVAATS